MIFQCHVRFQGGYFFLVYGWYDHGVWGHGRSSSEVVHLKDGVAF